MKMNWKLSVLLLASACSAKEQVPYDGVFAKMETNKGVILAQLEFEKTPLTIMNFVGLAEGRFDTPSKSKGVPYFDGLTFHRVEPGFVIQGGDPNGDGTGGPGYEFLNEIDPSLNHDKEGILSMANAGPDTNGSQFFITLGPSSFLNSGYSVFGQVVEGMDVVKEIEKGDRIEKVTIIRQGVKAKAFEPTWEQFQQLSQEISDARAPAAVQQSQKTKKALEDFVQQQWSGISFQKGEQGLMNYIAKPGSGENGAQLGDVKKYELNYTVWAPSANGTVNKVDSSFELGKFVEIVPGQVIEAWNITMPQMQKGEKRIMLVPSELGYGKQGSPPVIQPNSHLLFEMEMIGFVR